MSLFFCRLASLFVAGTAIALAGCQGNLGSGGAGISLPQTQPYGQPAGPGGATTQSRERVLDGAVFVTADMATIPLPPLDGFAVNLQLGTPPPSPSPTPSSAGPAVSASPGTPRPGVPHRLKTRAVALAAAPSPSPSSPPSAAPASAAPSPSPSTSPAGGPSPAASSPGPLASGSAKPASSPSGSPATPKTVTKLAVYPDEAPSAPTPEPSGNVQTYPVRKALVRGYVKPGADVPLYGLAAAKFTIPELEDTAQRGYTVAVFLAGKRHHEKLVVADARAAIVDHVVSSGATDSLVLKKDVGYLFVLYADELAPTPGAVPSGYPSPGNNPFYTPAPSGAPGAPYPPNGTSPAPGTTYVPGTFPTNPH